MNFGGELNTVAPKKKRLTPGYLSPLHAPKNPSTPHFMSQQNGRVPDNQEGEPKLHPKGSRRPPTPHPFLTSKTPLQRQEAFWFPEKANDQQKDSRHNDQKETR